MVAGDQYRTDKYRIGGVAMLDFGLTVFGAAAVSYFADGFSAKSFIFALIILIIMGIIVHVVIGQPTRLNNLLGLSDERKNNEGPSRFI